MPEKDITLTLPGDLAGWLRKCSPVSVIEDGVYRSVNGVVLEVFEKANETRVLLNQGFRGDIALGFLHLDLTDATGRAHATWWLAEGGGSKRWKQGVIFRPASNGRGWVLLTSDETWWWSLDGECGWPSCTHEKHRVPALANLDLDDPRLLPDGSRWVDAEALQLVCLHVAGVAP